MELDAYSFIGCRQIHTKRYDTKNSADSEILYLPWAAAASLSTNIVCQEMYLCASTKIDLHVYKVYPHTSTGWRGPMGCLDWDASTKIDLHVYKVYLHGAR